MHIAPASLDTKSIADYVEQAHDQSVVGFLMALIPTTMLSALTEGNILQTLFLAVLMGIAISLVGEHARPVSDLLERLAAIVFRIVGILMRAAPVGAFGAMAFTIGKYGVGVLLNLGALVACFFLTAFLFVAIVLGLVARLNGFSIWALLKYLKAELLLVLGTSSSEAALPSLIAKMEDAGCDKAVVGLVVPTGYSFNLDGTNIYMTLAALFIAQALDVHLTLGQEALLLSVAMLSSKGAAGVTGAGFITLAATLSIVPDIPVAGMALILGVDRFMSQCRSLTNFIGNAVATIVVARWEGALDKTKLDVTLNR
jgi:aerobic C4-dicarboxylate transport protein